MEGSLLEDKCMKQCRQRGYQPSECKEACSNPCNEDLLSQGLAQRAVRGAVREGLKDFKIGAKIGAEVDRFVRDARDINTHFRGCSEEARAGHVAEDWHRASYNIDAIKKGIDTRAAYTPEHSPADLSIGSLEAQLKYGSPKYLKTLNSSKYDGMQKIVPKGLANAAKGWSDKIVKDGAKSEPLSQEGAIAFTRDPGLGGLQLHQREPLVVSAAKTGFSSALAGGAFAGAFNGAVAALQGADSKSVISSTCDGVVQGAVSSGVSTAVTDVIVQSSGDAFLGAIGGGLASGAVRTGFSMHQCSKKYDEAKDQSDCRVKEAKKGSAAAAAATTATLLCSSVVGPFGFLCGAVAGARTRVLFDDLLEEKKN